MINIFLNKNHFDWYKTCDLIYKNNKLALKGEILSWLSSNERFGKVELKYKNPITDVYRVYFDEDYINIRVKSYLGSTLELPDDLEKWMNPYIDFKDVRDAVMFKLMWI